MMKSLRFIYAMAAAMVVLSCGGDEWHEQGILPKPAVGDTTSGDDPAKGEVGQALPAWKPGTFDIHFINTMAGEAQLLILPDGTQVMIDCAGSLNATGPVNSTTNEGIRVRWDPTKDPAYDCNNILARYLRSCMVWTKNSTLDYFLISHFHSDHMGALGGMATSSRSSTYKLASSAYIMDSFKVGTVLDRGYPLYNYPYDFRKYNNTVNNYIKAVEWHVANSGMKAEQFKPGRNDQIVLKHDPAGYPGFSVQNLAASGEVWTGSGTATVKRYPSLEELGERTADGESGENCPSENHNSCAARFTYGKFDYFAGGDLQYNGVSSFSWKDSETPVAMACGAVDVMKANHHGTANTNGSGYKDICWCMKYLKPKCWIVNNWVDGQPRKATFEGVHNLLPDTDIFITNGCELHKTYGGYDKALKGTSGHIVVRVIDGGAQYYVYVLNDRDYKMTIKSISGPYSSK